MKDQEKIKVYIAGPYTKGDVDINVQVAIQTGNQVANLGFYPYIPHLSHYWHLQHPQDYNFWMDLDDVYLCVCDCLLRIPGKSKGADQEELKAKKISIPVFYSIDELKYYYND